MDTRKQPFISFRCTPETREKLKAAVAALQANPPDTWGRATTATVAESALLEGLAVLVKRHGLPDPDARGNAP
jgi:hypothetical protein